MMKNYRNIYLPQFSSRLFTFYLIPEGYGFVDSYLSSPVSFMLPIAPRFYSTNEKNPSKKIKFIKPSSDNCFLDKDTNIEYVKTYGKWKCLNCGNKWYSAYSWLSLIFCNKNKNICRDNIYQEESKSKKIKLVFSVGVPTKLKDKDFLLQECKKCNNNKVKIISYSNLEGGYGDKYIPHRSDLCFRACLSFGLVKKVSLVRNIFLHYLNLKVLHGEAFQTILF